MSEGIASVQAHKLALAEKGLPQPSSIDSARSRHDSLGWRFR